MEQFVVQTKLQPPRLRGDVIHRHRLLTELRHSVQEQPVTLVSAPAGYGKTTLLSMLPQVLPQMRLVWISLDEEDNDPTRFLAALIAGLQQVHPTVGAGAQRFPGGSSANDQARRVMGLLINDIVANLPEPLILVMDDLHVVTEPAVLDALSYLIDRIPPQLRLVIATRHDPQLPLARLAARRQLAELRRPQLGFTLTEAEQLLGTAFDVSLSNADLENLLTRTEGWPVGLCLFAATLQRMGRAADRSTFIANLADNDRYVFQFLADEVLERQEPEVQRFLLQTSILNELTPELCRAVTGIGHAADILDRLYLDNLFIVSMNEQDDRSGPYRYHALFSDFLQKKLATVMPDHVKELHRRAAEAHPSTTRAVAHYIAAGLWEHAAAQIEALAPKLLVQGLLDTLRVWCHALPADVLEQRPLLLMLLGRCEIQRGNLSAARDALTQAQSGYARIGDRQGESAATTTLLSAVFLQGDWETMQGLVEAARSMPLGPLGQIQTLLPQTWLHIVNGEYDRAAASLHQVFHIAHASPDPTGRNIAAFHLGPLFATLPGCLSLVERFCGEESGADSLPRALGIAETMAFLYLWRGDVEAAIAKGKETLMLKERLSGYTWLGLYAAVWLSLAHAVKGDSAGVQQYADWVLSNYPNAPSIQHEIWLYGAGRAYWHIGEIARAEEVLRRMHLVEGRKALPLAPILREELTGLIAMSHGALAEAEILFRHVCAKEEDMPGASIAGTCRVPFARLLYDRGNLEEAWKMIEPALKVCARDRTPGIIVQWGDFAIPILQMCVARGDETGTAAHILGLLGASTAQSGLPELLSNRELDVLRILASGVSNREIAKALFVGEETVKSHVARILRKLNAENRTQAVSIAQRLGLINLDM